MDSEIKSSSDSDCDELANEILFVGDILQPFQFEPVFTATEIENNKDLSGTSAYRLWPVPTSQKLMHSQLTRWSSWSKAERWLRLLNSENGSICYRHLLNAWF